MVRIIFSTLLLAFFVGLTAPTHAAITQQIVVDFDPTPFPGPGGDNDRDSDSITGQTEAEINRALLASITGAGYSALGSVGEFGNYGVSGNINRTGSLLAQVLIEADVTAPVNGVAREAVARFIIDGGGFTFAAGQTSTLFFQLSLDSDTTVETDFLSRIELVGGPSAGAPTATITGDDIGATQSGIDIDIPFSFQTVSLGVLNPGQTLNLRYVMTIEAQINDFSEITQFQFQDPLTLSPPPDTSLLRPTIAFVSSVPEPSSAVLLGLIMSSALLRTSRRRRCKSSTG